MFLGAFFNAHTPEFTVKRKDKALFRGKTAFSII